MRDALAMRRLASAAMACANRDGELSLHQGPVRGDEDFSVPQAPVRGGNDFSTHQQPVRGDDAIPLFRELARQADQAPRWNFYKYVVDRQGKVVAQFPSLTKPDDPALQAAIEKAIASQP